MSQITESNWKQFKKIHEVAQERFCQQAVAKINEILAEQNKTDTEKFWALNQYQQDRAKEAVRLFADFRRIVAFHQVEAYYVLKLITEEELDTFSPDFASNIRDFAKLS